MTFNSVVLCIYSFNFKVSSVLQYFIILYTINSLQQPNTIIIWKHFWMSSYSTHYIDLDEWRHIHVNATLSYRMDMCCQRTLIWTSWCLPRIILHYFTVLFLFLFLAAQILSLHGADHGAVFLRLHTKPQGSAEKKLAVGWGSQMGCVKMILLTAGNIAHI